VLQHLRLGRQDLALHDLIQSNFSIILEFPEIGGRLAYSIFACFVEMTHPRKTCQSIIYERVRSQGRYKFKKRKFSNFVGLDILSRQINTVGACTKPDSACSKPDTACSKPDFGSGRRQMSGNQACGGEAAATFAGYGSAGEQPER
jgi:hypothetical protein